MRTKKLTVKEIEYVAFSFAKKLMTWDEPIPAFFYLFHKNKKWIRMSNIDLYNFAKGIAKSKPQSREKITIQIQNTLKKYIIPLNKA